jgi:CheY-like chemotaxis protein
MFSPRGEGPIRIIIDFRKEIVLKGPCDRADLWIEEPVARRDRRPPLGMHGRRGPPRELGRAWVGPRIALVGHTMAASSILIVDDTYPMARALSFLLTRAGYECRIAGDGVEALEKIEEEKPDLILLDIQMPRMDGFETCRRVRACEANKDIHIIVVTAMGQDEDAARALEAGANECIGKPVNPPELLAKVQDILHPVGP